MEVVRVELEDRVLLSRKHGHGREVKPVDYIDESDETEKPLMMPEIAMTTNGVDRALRYDNVWRGTHPDGLALVKNVVEIERTSTFSYGFNWRDYIVTTWHGPMVYVFSPFVKPDVVYEYINVPQTVTFRDETLRLSPLTPGATLHGSLDSYVIDHDVSLLRWEKVVTDVDVMGMKACVYGVVSGSYAYGGEDFTVVTKLPGWMKTFQVCPPLVKDVELMVMGARTGKSVVKVTELTGNVTYRFPTVTGDVLLTVKDVFVVRGKTSRGDSGGAVFWPR